MLHYALVSAIHPHGSAIGIHMSLPLEPPTPSHPSRWSQSTRLELPASYSKFPLVIFHMWGCICFSVTVSIHPSLSFPLCVQESLLYVSVSIAALQIGSLKCSVQFSSIPQSCLTLCPMDCSIPGLPVHHQLPKFTQTHFH